MLLVLEIGYARPILLCGGVIIAPALRPFCAHSALYTLLCFVYYRLLTSYYVGHGVIALWQVSFTLFYIVERERKLKVFLLRD